MACGNCGGSTTGSSCQCSFMSGRSVTVPGYGTQREPFRISVEKAHLQGMDTASATIRITGDGDTSSPYMLSINTVEQGDDKWRHWVGSQEAYNAVVIRDSKTLYAVIANNGSVTFPGIDKLMVGATEVSTFQVGAG